MPFVTEELFHRIPKRKDCHESIMISPYPQILQAESNHHPVHEEKSWDDVNNSSSVFFSAKIEEEFSYSEKINKEIRAAKSMYMKGNVKKQDPRVFVLISDDNLVHAFQKFKSYSNTLVWCSDIKVLTKNDPEPQGCSLTVVDDTCKVFVELSGLGLDYNAEISRLEKNLKNVENQLEKLNGKMSAKNYKEKIPAEIHEANVQKKISLDGELEMTKKAIQLFKSLL